MGNRTIRRLLAVFAGMVVVTGSIFFLRSGVDTAPDYPMSATGNEIIIEIPTGATGFEIARLLFDKGIVKSSAAFFQVAVVDKRSEQIAPGAHRLQQKIPAKEALDQLLDSARIPNLLKVAEGAWTDEIFTQLIAQGFTKVELAKALPKLTLPLGFSGIEGIFFPAQYSFARGATALIALQAMVDRFSVEAEDSGLSAGSGKLPPMQLLTIASLIQAEGDQVDFAKISQVIRNRLKIGMPLQLDATVQYVQRKRGQVFVSSQSMKIPSPYNTYLHYGLPPGPIGNPGRAAMDAALHPEIGNWLYFITVKPGDTRFTEAYSEFLRWKSSTNQSTCRRVWRKAMIRAASWFTNRSSLSPALHRAATVRWG